MGKRIAITGGIGSGKTTLLNMIASKGYPVFSCDEIYREIAKDISYIERIKVCFPSCVIDGKIDKRRLSEIVFNNEEKRKQLNAIAHPLIMEKLKEKMQACKSILTFAEVPLLFEGDYEKDFDEIIVVLRDLEDKIVSVMHRDNLDRREIEDRMKAQFSYYSEEGRTRMEACRAILVHNHGDKIAFEKEVDKILADLQQP